MDAHLACKRSPLQGEDLTVSTVRYKLSKFHDDTWSIKKKWGLRKVQTATYDYEIKVILRLMNESEGVKRP
ncbi:hypothetical protein BGZ58_007044 [Dissophora ornata]|nr:hypothetical protein BGZ58_007044 [Dissophora ornata]